ncbi:MAG: glucose-1-phosphate adenylyltransferase [Myxococcales bacterium]|nr:glucose-1-phosphate adenylyltransferase [Myxococcales bacterium]
MRRVLAVIMGGGRGKRLYPLTSMRCKPAVPLGGMYRLVDIPISNCLNSNYNQIYLLTQFNTASLHRHVRESYRFDCFSKGFVELLAAEQTEQGDNWYQGTADAVRQNLKHIGPSDDDLVLILSGDQLYQMDYRNIVKAHLETGAEVTVSSTPVVRELAHAFGLMKVGEDLSIREFVEKPSDEKVIDDLILPPSLSSSQGDKPCVLASMGIYVFSGRVLREALDSKDTDFGREVIPGLLGQGKLFAHIFNGYWEDIGTIPAFFEANLRLTDEVPPFNFFDPRYPIYTRTRFLPAAKVNHCDIRRSIVAGGTILSAATLERCVIGIRNHVRSGTIMRNTIMMGAERIESVEEREQTAVYGQPPMGVGHDCEIENTILDANVRVGNRVKLSPKGKPDGFMQGDVMVKDGVLIVMKNGVLPDGTSLWHAD